MKSDEESYLYVNEGGFTPGMYLNARRIRRPAPAPAKRPPWRLFAGADVGAKREPETLPPPGDSET